MWFWKKYKSTNIDDIMDKSTILSFIKLSHILSNLVSKLMLLIFYQKHISFFTYYYFSLLTCKIYEFYSPHVIMHHMFRIPFQILRNNMIFIQPLLLFMLLLMSASIFIAGRNMYMAPRISLAISFVLLTVAFIAGWLHINKLGIKNYCSSDEQEIITQKSIDSFKQFFVGVGENFFKVLFAFLLMALIYSAVMYGIMTLCLKQFGTPTLIMDLPNIAKNQTNAELVAYLNNISVEDKLNFISWVWSAIVSSSIMNYFSLLYLVVVVNDNKNIFVSLWKTLKFFFRNILLGLLVIFIMFFLYFFLNLLSFIVGANSFSFAILIILFTLYLNYYVLLVFWIYNERTKTNSDNRSE